MLNSPMAVGLMIMSVRCSPTSESRDLDLEDPGKLVYRRYAKATGEFVITHTCVITRVSP